MTAMDERKEHPIGVVCRRTGLSPHVIRIWERRYGAVQPERTDTNRRLYSEKDILRLRLLKETAETGRSIGYIAHLPDETLREYVAADREASVPDREARRGAAPGESPGGARVEPGDIRSTREACLDAVLNLESERLDAILSSSRVRLGLAETLYRLIIPLLQQIGDRWHDGSLRIAHEHLAVAVIRSFLGGMLRNAELPATAPVAVSATPPGQLHELGAMIAAVTAVREGWRAVYLGPNVPAEELALAVRRSEAGALLLSVLHAPDPARLVEHLDRIAELVDGGVPIVLGGRISETAVRALPPDRFLRVPALEDLGGVLAGIARVEPDERKIAEDAETAVGVEAVRILPEEVPGAVSGAETFPGLPDIPFVLLEG